MAVRYLIDGYNLAHAAGDLFGKVSRHGLERARNSLVARIARGHRDTPGAVTIAFDARNARADLARDEVVNGVHVMFAIREEADDLIERLIRGDSVPKQLVVVSSDRRLKEAGRRRGCRVMSSDEYLDWLERARPREAQMPISEKPESAVIDEESQLLDVFQTPKKRQPGPD